MLKHFLHRFGVHFFCCRLGTLGDLPQGLSHWHYRPDSGSLGNILALRSTSIWLFPHESDHKQRSLLDRILKSEICHLFTNPNTQVSTFSPNLIVVTFKFSDTINMVSIEAP